MPDTVERTIYKLELDDSGYIKGVENLAASTKKLAAEQEAANKRLAENEAQLKKSAEVVEKNKKALESYTGADKKYKDQLEQTLKTSQASHAKVVELVNNVRKSYDAAKKSADDFAKTAQKATEVQQNTTGGKIPTGPPPGIPSPVAIPPTFNLTDVIPQTKAQFDQLAASIAAAEAHLATLNVESEEFKQMKPIVDQAKVALKQYSDITNDTGNKTLSLRGQLRQAKEELVRLEQAGQGATKAYFDLEKRTARLTDELADQQQRIKILSSDTKLLDFGKGAITAATSAFQTYASVSILAGSESQELQKKTMQLFAAMQLLQSLEQLSNLTRREGVIAVHLQSAAQATYTAVVGASTGALRAFRLALLATGVGAAVIGIGFLVKKYQEYRDAIKEAGENQKLLNEIVAEGNKEAGKQIADLKILTEVARNSNLPLKERLAAVKALQKEFPDYFGNLSKETILTGDITKATNDLTKSLIAAARARAAKGRIDEIESKKLDLDFQRQKVINATNAEAARVKAPSTIITTGGGTAGTTSGVGVTGASIEQQREVIRRRRDAALKAIDDEVAKLNQQENFLSSFVGVDQLAKVVENADKDLKGSKGTKIENVFVKTLRDLLDRLRAASKGQIQSVDLIQQEFTDKLFTEVDKIDELVSKKQLTKKQGNLLTKIIENIIGKEANKAIDDFKKKVQAAITKLQDEIDTIQNKANLDSINLIQDEFDRRARLIEENEEIELENAERATQDRLDALELDRLLIGEEQYQKAKAVIIATGEQNALNIIAGFGQQRQDLAADVFKKSLDTINKGFEEQILQADEITAGKIQSEKALFQSGSINYEEYQKRITKILKEQKETRDKLRLQELNTELSSINKRLETVTTAAEREDLENRQRAVRNQIAELNSQTNVDEPNKKKRDTIVEYASAVDQLSQSIIGFWQRANEAESAALDRSISLQEKRVEAATRIAARGNAEYLKQEEDRLKELQVKREAAARKQLGIDAALQASQVLVGITGAISKIASSPFGAETIAEIAIIIGALATGYGIVKSLQGNQPKLAKGDPYVRRNGAPAGVDTIPAWLNEGEAVIPTEKNKAYHPTIRAVYDGTVPAEDLNNFVKTYHKIKAVPQVDYGRIEGVAQLSIGQDGKMVAAIAEQNRLIIENNDLQRLTLRAMKNMSVSANIDKDGVSIMINEYLQQMIIDKKT